MAQGFTRRDFFQADTRGSVTRQYFLDRFAAVRAHLYDTTHAFFLSFTEFNTVSPDFKIPE